MINKTNKHQIIQVIEKYNTDIKSFLILNYKTIGISFLVVFTLFCIALLPLFRANVNYIDDSMRALQGNRDWLYLHSRWVSEYLSVLVHADISLRDISPFPQLIAVFLMSFSSILLCWIVFDGKLTKSGVLISTILGLNPLILEFFAFKFDSPYMTLSVLASIFPFIFAFKNDKLFAIVSFFGLLIMLTTYQFSAGIYIMIVIFLIFQSWNSKSKDYIELKKFFLISSGCYLVALTFFRLFLMQERILKLNTVFSINEIIPGMIDNVKDNFEYIVKSFGDIWIFGSLSISVEL